MSEHEQRNPFSDQSRRPAEHGFSITPNDGAELPDVTRGVYIGTAGDLHVLMSRGDEVTFIGLAAGLVHPLQIRKVFSTGTTALNIVGVH